VFGAEVVLERIRHTLAPIAGQCVLISYSLPALVLARQQTTFPLGAVFDRWAERCRPVLASLKPEYVFSDADHAPRFGRIAFANAKTAFYEVTDPARALQLAAQGADLIETFAFGEMQEALTIARGAHPVA
jgi:glycerophosphoryl diester phosphodiesterase